MDKPWIAWDGSQDSPPVSDETRVDVRDRDGFEWLDVSAGSHPWMHFNSQQDIVAYRVREVSK